jgi:RHS repeat-associated protein
MIGKDGVIGQQTDYYAFGMEISRGVSATPSPDNKYKYNGKELQDELGTYDYGSRQYDPVIGRWGVIDILAEKYERYSPYAYALNNPIKFIDKDGKEVVIGGPLAQAFVDKLNKESTFQFKLVDSKLMAVNPNAQTDPFSSRLVDAINSPKSITFATTPQDENTYIDQLYTGKVDQGDLDALNGDAYKTAVLQFTGERLSLDNYDAFTVQFAKDFPTGSFRDNPAARPNYTNGQKTGLGDKANAAGHDLVAGFLKESNIDKLFFC